VTAYQTGRAGRAEPAGIAFSRHPTAGRARYALGRNGRAVRPTE
jgi:hypothetical protein